MKRLFSGIQPSGPLGLGNYLGAIRHWVAKQTDYDCLFCLVDLHTLTVTQSPDVLRARCYDHLALFLACGLDPEQVCLFFQSQRPEHTQLAWVLSCVTQMGELNRMTQYKDKADQHGANAGLFLYPVLMAADILLYGAHGVPVGHDQKQHLELARDLAHRFNHHYGACFTIPEPYIPPQGARIMSLQEPTKKMSKSDKQVNNYITLLDEPEVILRKIKRAVTDSEGCVAYDEARPGITNLMTIYHAITGESYETITQRYQGQGYGVFKKDLAACLIETLAPIQDKYRQLREDQAYLTTVSEQGAEKAGQLASAQLDRVYDALGLIRHHV